MATPISSRRRLIGMLKKFIEIGKRGRVILNDLGKACVYLAERLDLEIRKYGD